MNPTWLASLSGARRHFPWAGLAVLALCGSVASVAFGQDDDFDAEAPPPSKSAQATDFLPQDIAPELSEGKLTRRNQRKAEALASYIEGSLAEAAAETEKALAEYRNVLNVDPGAVVTTPEGEELLLSVKVAYELARRGEVSEGINLLKDSIKAVPDDPIALLYLAQLYSRYLRKPEMALQYAKKAVDLEPAQIEVYQSLSEIYLASDDPKKARQALDRAANVETDDPMFWADLGELYRGLLTTEDTPADAAALETMDPIFARAVKLAGDDPEVLVKAADYYVLTDRVAKAVPLYEAVVEQKRKSSEPPVLDLRDKLARAYLATGQRDRAITEYQAITRLNPLRFESYEMLGQLYQDGGEWDRALSAYQQSLLLAPNQPMNYLRIAVLQQETERYDQAAQTLIEARKRFPDYPRITYSLAIALTQAKRMQEAVTSFEEALLEAQLAQDDMVDASFYYNYGIAAHEAGLEEKVVELMDKSIELDPANAGPAYNFLGYMWVDSDRNLERGGELIRKALALEPDNAAYIDSLGWFFYKTGEYQKAVEELLRAASLQTPPDPTVFDHIGDAYAKLGNAAQALAYWQKSAALDSTNDAVAAKIEAHREKVTSLPGPTPNPAR